LEQKIYAIVFVAAAVVVVAVVASSFTKCGKNGEGIQV